MSEEILDNFSTASQVSARARGDYDRIAQEAENSGRCVFCNLKNKYVITEYKGVVLTVNLFPRSTGDLVVIPRRHIERYSDLTFDEHLAIAHLNNLGMELLSQALGIDAIYFLLREGKGTDKTVKHLHAQIMHYWPGLIDWHPQENLMKPIKVAEKLRETLEEIKNGKS